MVRPKKNQQHPNLQSAIKETAREQIAERGAAALSLRRIARELNITAPAIYNYFPSRDELVTALIVDAYHSLAVALAEASDVVHDNHAASITAAANAYRTWALTHAEEYALIFGTPIPDYHAPMEVTGPAAAESMSVLIRVLDAAYQDGKLELGDFTPALGEMLGSWTEKFEYEVPPGIIHLALACWAQIHGLVSLELFGHLSVNLEYEEVESLFEVEIQAMLARMGAA